MINNCTIKHVQTSQCSLAPIEGTQEMLCKRQFRMTFDMIYISVYKEKCVVWLKRMSFSSTSSQCVEACDTAAANHHQIHHHSSDFNYCYIWKYGQTISTYIKVWAKPMYDPDKPIRKRQTWHFTLSKKCIWLGHNQPFQVHLNKQWNGSNCSTPLTMIFETTSVIFWSELKDHVSRCKQSLSTHSCIARSVSTLNQHECRPQSPSVSRRWCK